MSNHIPKGFTKKQVKDLMVEMWSWLRDHPQCGKGDFQKAHPDYPRLMSGCAACEYAMDQEFALKKVLTGNMCSHCPIDLWRATPGDYDTYYKCEKELHGRNFYGQWDDTENYNTRKRRRLATEVLKYVLSIKV